MADESKDRESVVGALDGICDAIFESFGGFKPKPSGSVVEALNQIRKEIRASSGSGKSKSGETGGKAQD